MDSHGTNRFTGNYGYFQTRGGFRAYSGYFNKTQHATKKTSARLTKDVETGFREESAKDVMKHINSLPGSNLSKEKSYASKQGARTAADIKEVGGVETKQKVVPKKTHLTTARSAVDKNCVKLQDNMQIAEG